MDASLRKLTLVCPQELRPALADALDGIEPTLPGYTILDASGHGPDTHPSNAAERVQGAVRMAMFILVLPEERVGDALDAAADRIHRPQMAFWVEPVEDYGRLS